MFTHLHLFSTLCVRVAVNLQALRGIFERDVMLADEEIDRACCILSETVPIQTSHWHAQIIREGG